MSKEKLAQGKSLSQKADISSHQNKVVQHGGPQDIGPATRDIILYMRTTINELNINTFIIYNYCFNTMNALKMYTV